MTAANTYRFLGVGGLPFFGMILGEILAGVFMLFLQPRYNRQLAANNNMPIPEWRLPPVILGGVLFGAGLLWFGKCPHESCVVVSY